MSDDDRRLIAECLGGRRDAFGDLVTRYQARLYNAALRLVPTPDDAADVVQEAFLNAFQSLHTFKGDAEFFTWLYRIAFNTAISLKRKKRPTVSLENSETGIDPNDPSEYVKPGSALERTEDEQQLSLAIARLSPEHREVLLLKDIEGLKYEDIAESLRVPIGTIRSRLHRARLELRALLVSEEQLNADTRKIAKHRATEITETSEPDGTPAANGPASTSSTSRTARTQEAADIDEVNETEEKEPLDRPNGPAATENPLPQTPARRVRRAE